MTEPTEAAPAARPDTAAMTERQLAEAVLARSIRPRIGEIRRLAEAVLAKGSKKSAKKGKGGKSGKLAKIPGQKSRKKKA